MNPIREKEKTIAANINPASAHTPQAASAGATAEWPSRARAPPQRHGVHHRERQRHLQEARVVVMVDVRPPPELVHASAEVLRRVPGPLPERPMATMGQIASQRLSAKRQVSSRTRRKMITYPQTSRKDWKVAAGETLSEAKLTLAPIRSSAATASARAGDSTRTSAHRQRHHLHQDVGRQKSQRPAHHAAGKRRPLVGADGQGSAPPPAGPAPGGNGTGRFGALRPTRRQRRRAPIPLWINRKCPTLSQTRGVDGASGTRPTGSGLGASWV